VSVRILEPPRSAAARLAAARASLAPIAGEYPFTPRFLEHPDGVAQHYLDEGPRSGTTVLLLHGNPTWSFAWRAPLALLRERVRCVAPDHVGCGLSDKPARYPYRLQQHVENLERLVQALGLERLTLVVHDWGGPIGFGLARRHPELVERIVVTNTASFALDARLPLRLDACRVPWLGKLAVQGLNAFARGALWMAAERRLAPAVKRGYLLPYDSWSNRVATHAFVEDIPLGPEHPSWGELAAIERSLAHLRDRPVRILWGERDWVFTPRYRQEWERRFPAARVTRFERAGHYLFEDEAEEFARELAAFAAPHS
jgi:haloalkane dehalogenase